MIAEQRSNCGFLFEQKYKNKRIHHSENSYWLLCALFFFRGFVFGRSVGRSDRRRRRDGLSNFFHQQWAMRYYAEVKERRTEKNAHVCVCVISDLGGQIRSVKFCDLVQFSSVVCVSFIFFYFLLLIFRSLFSRTFM